MPNLHARRPIWALVTALVMWAPSMKAYVTGAVDLVTAGTRFLVAFIVAWIGVSILCMVIAGYGNVTHHPRRRVNDVDSADQSGGQRVGVDDG